MGMLLQHPVDQGLFQHDGVVRLVIMELSVFGGVNGYAAPAPC